MSRINTNVQSLIAQRVLGQNNNSLSQSLERLSTGLRIVRGGDDPAGLIASETLRSELAATGAAINNAERAEQVVNIAEGGLTEVSSLLTELQGLITTTANSAGLSEEEVEANQLQIDSILQTIDRIASATSFQGLRLLNGNLDYTTSNLSGDVTTFAANGAKLGFGQKLDVDVLVTNSAQVGGFYLSFAGAQLDLGASDQQFVLEITGAEGARELSFASGTTLGAIADSINTFTDVTGVKATVSTNNTGLRLESTEVGSDEFVSVKVRSDGGIGTGGNIGFYEFNADDTNTADAATLATFGGATNGLTDEGQDIAATINGILAVGKGSRASINTDFLNVDVDLSTSTTTGTANSQTLGKVDAFTITGGGADFQLAGQVDIAGKVSLGIANVAARALGQVSDGSELLALADLGGGQDLSLEDGDLTMASKVVGKAITEISALRGRLGAFQKNTIGATIRSLGVAFENTTAAESVIRDADFAEETASLTRAQILVSSTTNVLGLANSQPQAVLQLLG